MGIERGKAWILEKQSGVRITAIEQEIHRQYIQALGLSALDGTHYSIGALQGLEEGSTNQRDKEMFRKQREVLETALASLPSPSASTTTSIPALSPQPTQSQPGASSASAHDPKRTMVFSPLKFHTPSAGSARSLFGRIGSDKSLTGRLFHWMGRSVLQTSYSQAFSVPAPSPAESAAKSPEVTKSESTPEGRGDAKKDEPKKDDKKK